MSLTAAAIRALADKGLSASDIADIAEANAPTQSAAAIRQKRYRDNKRCVTRDVTPPLNDIYSKPPGSPPVEAIASTAPKGKNRNRTGDRLPEVWQPKPFVNETAAMVAVWPAGMLERQLAQFRDHYASATGAKGRSLDWDAKFRTWLRNADQWMKERNGNRPANDELRNPLARACIANEQARRNRADGDEGEFRLSGSPAF